MQPMTTSAKATILFVPGYKGSALRDSSSGKRIWVTLSQELFGDRSLALPLESLGIEQEALEPDGVLEQVNVIPGLYSINIYRSWLQSLQEIAGARARVLGFSYDWRQSNVTSAEELRQEVLRLRESGVQKIYLVAHSMGGLVVSHFMRYDENGIEDWRGVDQIDGVVFVGTGFLGAAAVFRDMQRGSINKYNKVFLNQRAISTFPSAYQLIPPRRHPMLLDPQGNSQQESVFDADTWLKNNWGLFKESGISETQKQARLQYVKANLQDAAQFHDRLHAPAATMPRKRIPLLNIFALGETTLGGIVVYEKDNEVQLVYNQQTLDDSELSIPFDMIAHSGDNVITEASAQLPEVLKAVFRTETVSVQAAHAEIGNNPIAQAAIRSFLDEVSAAKY